MFEILTWNKTNPTPMTNNTFLPDIEYCLYFREKGVPLNDGYELKSKWYISPINKNDKDLFNHPTIKPLELVKRHIKHTTQENDIVLDCFMGSGTTAVACKELGRHYIGFEVNPKYYQIAIDRVNGLTVADRKKKEAGQLSLFDIE
jgi:DNA modification methylase